MSPVYRSSSFGGKAGKIDNVIRLRSCGQWPRTPVEAMTMPIRTIANGESSTHNLSIGQGMRQIDLEFANLRILPPKLDDLW